MWRKPVHPGARRRVEEVAPVEEFLGTHTPRLDDKGRLFLPARYRAALAGGLVMTTGQENCLYVFPTEEFHRISTQMQAAPSSSKNVRDIVRVFRASAHSDTPDRQGRVTIPAALRSYAGLDKDCTVIGNGSRLEVWDSARWNAYLAEVMPAYSAYSVETQEVVPGL
jgi:MraZ protein